MSTAFVGWRRYKEVVMSCVEYDSDGLGGPASENRSDVDRPKLFVVPYRESGYEDEVARRVAQVLDFELMQGSMPA